MRLLTLISLSTVLQLDLSVSARATQAEAKAVCGDLGVMDLGDIPADVNPEEVRLCKEHPEGKAGSGHSTDGLEEGLEKREAGEGLEKRECWHGSASYGCSKKGYCWKTCAQPTSGQWCWTAANNGFGPWYTCSKTSDCNRSMQCGAGGCKDCGCSC